MPRLNRAAVLQTLDRADEAGDELVALLAMPDLTPTAGSWARQLLEQR
jgi:hypothetical protein